MRISRLVTSRYFHRIVRAADSSRAKPTSQGIASLLPIELGKPAAQTRRRSAARPSDQGGNDRGTLVGRPCDGSDRPAFGTPQKQALWGNRRYWPTVRAWFDRQYISGRLSSR
jgi:hypothetical protein